MKENIATYRYVQVSWTNVRTKSQHS